MRRARFPIALLALVAACGGPATVRPVLPENIAADPRGPVGVVAPAPTSSLPTALRALGVPFRILPPGEFNERMLDGLSLVLVDEGALDDLAVAQILPRLLDETRTSGEPLLILAQTVERGIEVLRRNAAPFEPRPMTHGVNLAAPKGAHRVLTAPNVIRGDDLAALSGTTTQLAHGRNARAIIAGNLERPDSSAALLRVAYGKGTLWYVACPLAAGAADGHAAEQRLLANLVSLGAGD